VRTPPKPVSGSRHPAFSLVEVVAVIAVMLLLMTAGIRMLSGTSAQSKKTATDACLGLIEQARATAITSRSYVVLAIAEPGDLPADDDRCLIGLFKIKDWPATAGSLDGILLRRWQALPNGIVLLPGGVKGLRNPRDEPETKIRYQAGQQTIEGRFHILAFNSRGGLHWPAGSDPLALRIAEGAYRNRQPTANARGGDRKVAENTLRIGRLTARPYRFDG
jgi:type II secretory pathway pseudopilin PulG